eukprot:COSAG06_NODE_2975_length_6006_cov_6.088708_3_plen_59_part_00
MTVQFRDRERRQPHGCVVQASYRDPHAPARSKARQNDQKGAGISPLFGTDGETNSERD